MVSVNLPVLSVVAVYSLADGTRLVGLLLEDLQRVGKAAEEAALRISVASHLERVEDEVSEERSPQSLVVSFRCVHSFGRLVGRPAGQARTHMNVVGNFKLEGFVQFSKNSVDVGELFSNSKRHHRWHRH